MAPFPAYVAVLAALLAGCTTTDADAQGCALMENPATREVACFGCSGGVCNEPPVGWITVADIDGSCVESSDGCRLVE